MQASLGELSLGWREGLLALILTLVLYMLFLLWRMRRINRRKEMPVSLKEPGNISPLDNLDPDAESELNAEDGADREPVWVAPNADFAREAFMDGVERELEQMREEVDSVRGALSRLREELAVLREDFQQEVLAARTVQNASPLYSDAMQMAMLGHDALTISERCGIARAEADLVVALVKNKDA